jgi:hypothetical protein
VSKIKDEFQKAGMDTASNELENAARDLLSVNDKDPAKCLAKFKQILRSKDDLFSSLVTQYLIKVAAGMPATAPATASTVKTAVQASKPSFRG